jgi:hypothetical protein
MAIRAFLSFVEEDLQMVNLFRGQARNKRFDLEFADYSVKEPYDSVNADYIRRQITDQIKPTTLTVCLYGPTTWQSKWVGWELDKTIELKKPLMGVCLYSDGRVKYYPSQLQNYPRVNWDTEQIVNSMTGLANQYRQGR